MKTSKVTIINAYGRTNRGDSVLLDECISEIKQKHPQSKIGVCLFDSYNSDNLDSEVERLERIGNSHFKNRYIDVMQKIYCLVISLLLSRLNWSFLFSIAPHRIRKTLKHIRDSDIVISAPGGYIHDTNYAYLIALCHLWLGINFKKNTILAPQSIGPLRSPIARWLVRKTLNRCDLICARESYTYDFLIDIGVATSKIEKTGDSAFWNLNATSDLTDKSLAALDILNHKFVGMTVVNWTFPHSKNVEVLRTLYISNLAKLIEDIYLTHGLRTVIFNQVSDDLCIAYALKSAVKLPEAIIIDSTEKEPAELRAMISRSTTFVGTRFHSCIFAIMAGVPTIAISYLPKTEFILKDLNLSERSLPIDDIHYETLKYKVFKCIDNNYSEAKLMSEAVANYQNNFKRLKDYI